ncbi:ArsR/SmtB family transcription factor [Chloroflexus sp.]|uniref:ArsR/SmtB family transcription factor n=1 Tax=Chloroflexus sp. TaxID=1904827 RepID=UPI00404A1E74
MATAHQRALEQDDRRLALICKALSHPVRVQILRYVLRHPGCIVNQIVLHMPEDGPHAQSTISQHLRVLRDASLLETYDDGAAVCHYVNPDSLVWLREYLEQL